ncbi:hypothetical protein PUN28_017335 [Cardiocondyla obscurior]|uniref:Uncharacterized protein n=1 Tax=Cardiocondyla obscurior TaxID=286306 RepID=A0AAW2EMN2_9HYME
MDTYARSERSPRPYRSLAFATVTRAGGGGSALPTPRNVLVVSCCSLYVSYAKLCPIVQLHAHAINYDNARIRETARLTRSNIYIHIRNRSALVSVARVQHRV